VLAFAGHAIGEAEHDAAQVFATAVGGGMSSPLFQELREKRGLAYAVNAFHWSFADAGLFGVYAGSAPKDAGELMAAALETLAEATQRLDDGAVARAKAQLKVATLSVLEQPGARAQQLARQLFAYGRVVPLEEAIARIDAIDAAAARKVGAAMLASAPTVAAIGRIGKVMGAEKVARRLAAA
jgi:predicted Zn-dependent peptidase